MRKETLRILFVCVENACRSQMAQGFAEAFGKGKLEVYSAGSRSSSHINPLAIEVMKEKDIDLSDRRPKGLNDLPRKGIKTLFLLTIAAADFFKKLGYEVTQRSLVPAPIVDTEEFKSICPVSAICLFKNLEFSRKP